MKERKGAGAVPRVLSVAGSDSGGGAGIQADLKTFTARCVYGASVVTALTAQNTIGVQGVHVPPTKFVEAQLESVLSDIGFNVAKTGMLPTPEIINACARAFRAHSVRTVVVDPVLVATSGDVLVGGADCISALKSQLFPLATLLTPNLPEAEKLTGRSIRNSSDVRQACIDLVGMGCAAVLLKGGHEVQRDNRDAAPGESDMDAGVATDILFDGKEFHAFSKPRLDAQNTHGTGCTLAAAIAAELAKGAPLSEAVSIAKSYVYEGIAHGLALGRGHGPLNHMVRMVSDDERGSPCDT